MVYNSFVKRSLIERVRAQNGKYFAGSLPDVTSGIVNAAFCKSFLSSSRPLSVAGLSQHSTGHKLTRADTRPTQDDWQRDFPDVPERDFDAGSNLEYLIAGEMVLVAEQVLHDPGLAALDGRGLVTAMARAINDSPSRYDETRSAILGLLERFGIAAHEIVIPTRQPQATAPPKGVRVLGPYQVLFVLDGDRIGLRSIADAVMLAAELVPGMDAMTRASPADETEKSPLVPENPALARIVGRVRRALRRRL